MKPKEISRQQKAELCIKCHGDGKLMARYGMTTGAVASYEQSFHGKALLRFKHNAAATCTDCHGLHGVLAPTNPDAPTNKNHVAATCSQCHKYAKMNFAMSGANHLRLKIERTPLLRIEEFLFKLLIFGTMGFLTGMVMLDMRRKLFTPECKPTCGRPIALLIGLSFIILVAGIVLAYFRVRGVEIAWLSAFGVMLVAIVINRIQRKRLPAPVHEKHYKRINTVMRMQHFLLALSFTLLVLTGMPLRFADVSWTHDLLSLFGGFDGARIVHRVAGLLMIVNWCWHLGYLLYRWKQYNFSFKSWTMFPSRKDATDMLDTIKYGLGIVNSPPQFDRFQFREKFDYFADMWGTVVMGLGGFLMWFPAYLGNHLPDFAFGVAYIAHSYEALLAMLAIVIWHFYNTHFNPDTFPMNPTWFTGEMSASEMEREHPLEKARLDEANQSKEVRPLQVK